MDSWNTLLLCKKGIHLKYQLWLNDNVHLLQTVNIVYQYEEEHLQYLNKIN